MDPLCNSGKKYKKCCMGKETYEICSICEECKIIDGNCDLCTDVIHYREYNKGLELNTRNIATAAKNPYVDYFVRKYSLKQLSHFRKVVVPRVSKKVSRINAQIILEEKYKKLNICNSLLENIDEGEYKDDLIKKMEAYKEQITQLESDMEQSASAYYNSENPLQVFKRCFQCKKIVAATNIMVHFTDDDSTTRNKQENVSKDLTEEYCKKCYNKKFSLNPRTDILL